MSDLQQKIDRITDILRRDDGISGAMHYTEQISWVLFLKFLHDYENNKHDEAELEGKKYNYVIHPSFRWDVWACPRDAEGKPDIKKRETGAELNDFVNGKLFPYLQAFKNNAPAPTSLQYKIGSIFEFISNRIASGHTLREVLDIIDTLNFQSSSDLFEMSHVYENLLRGMGSDGGNSGEFYTPRPVIKAMVAAVDPHVGQKVFDGAVGSAGFLIEAYEHMKAGRDALHASQTLHASPTHKGQQSTLSTTQLKKLNTETLYGNEKTPLAYVMGMMNMILHGIESPNLYKQNSLTQNIRDIQEKDRYDVILANPPFGGKEKAQIQQNFPVESTATELLFLQYFMKYLARDGKAAIIFPEGILFQTNNAFKQVKQELLANFNLHTIVSLPAGIFLPYSGVKTNIVFFDRKGGTKEVWYYEMNPPYKLTKNKPILNEHFDEFLHLYTHPAARGRGSNWTVSLSDIIARDYDLSAKNPHNVVDEDHLPPAELMEIIRKNDNVVSQIIDEIDALLDKENLGCKKKII